MRALFRTEAILFKEQPGSQALAGVTLLLLLLTTGYSIPIPNIVGALKWLSDLNPMRFAFENIFINEFHTLNGTCSTLVPFGPEYENIPLSSKVCATVGSQPGEAFVDGNAFAKLSFTFEYSHLWRNFGFMLVFFGFFFIALLVLTELKTLSTKIYPSVLFKRGSEAPELESIIQVVDEEKGDNSKLESRMEVPKFDESLAAKELAMSNVFSWQHVRYDVPVHRQNRRLLDDVSGFVAPGKLTALMGESGAGKTTLLNVLAQRADVGVISGHQFVNGQALPMDFQAQTGYCQQADTHLPQDTVREALLFSAKLRQPQHVSIKEKEAYVDICLKMCGLEAYADAMVGSLGVELRKRTTIAVELAAKPKLLLFLDEPTSGLDSQTAWAIVNFLRKLADSGQAILCTIHQPSGELFQVFDRLLLLRKGGQTVYFGDLGHNSTTIIKYFERNGAHKCQPNDNPAEWMLDVIGAGATASTSVDWHAIWDKSPEASALQDELEKLHADGRRRPPVLEVRKSAFATSWLYQFVTLTKRSFVTYWRDPTYIISKLMLNISAGLLVGFMFYQADDSLQGTQNKLFAIFLALILTFPLSNQILVKFIDVRDVFEIREDPSRIYSWTSFLLSQIVVEIPFNIFVALIFFLCWFWTVGLDSGRLGYTFLTYVVAFPPYYTTVAIAFASTSPNAVVAGVMFGSLFSFVVGFCGVLQPYSSLGWWKWMYRLSPYTYLVEGLMGQAVGHQQITCSSNEVVTIIPPSGQTCQTYLSAYISHAGGYLVNPDASSSCQVCPVRTTDDVLAARFNVSYDHHWRNLGLFCGYIVFNIFAIYVLHYIFRTKKGNFGSVFQSIKRRIVRRP